MLEKIGLPAKPSMRGGNWVLDASHCQGCSSQFTFINRKHHCRRCGGLFCNNCTQQRMVLRGQGDSPVRICDPCKRLEEAARFELRYGLKNRNAKGGTKHSSNHEDEVIGKILGTEGEKLLLSGRELEVGAISLQSFASTGSSSNAKEDDSYDRKEEITRSMSADIHSSALTDLEPASPEELRQLAVEEKKKHKILKAEGKSVEALQAFKRGKELERQAAALELALRKSRRMASKAPNANGSTVTQKIDGHEDLKSKQKMPFRRSNEAKSDLESELKDLGWSDADLHDSDVKPTKLSLEGELSNLLGEITQSSSTGGQKRGVDKSEVTAIKKRALLLKREGKLAEAKEELKKAKILEKKLEEEEFLGESEESDDEISALIRSIDEGKQDDFLMNESHGPSISFDQFNRLSNDLPIDENFDVTDSDMNDPELAAALKSFGWSEEDDEHAARKGEDQEPTANQQSVLQEKVLSLKREALSQKRAGNVSEAMELLKKAKLLERNLGSLQPAAEIDQKSYRPQTSISQMKKPTKSKLSIQKELLAVKKRALTLRREGRIDEAEEELKKGKVLEQELEEIENATTMSAPKVTEKNVVRASVHDGAFESLNLGEEDMEAEVTEQDMHDPALLSALKTLGWGNDDIEPISTSTKNSKLIINQPLHDHVPSSLSGKAVKSQGEIQRELLAVKRRALALRRQGRTTEAEEELEKAKALENQMAEMENTTKVHMHKVDKRNQESIYLDDAGHGMMDLEGATETEVTEQDIHDPALLSALNSLGWIDDDVEPAGIANKSSKQINNQAIPQTGPSLSSGKAVRSKAEIQRELLAIKRKALALRRQGKTEDAEEELEKAKALETELESYTETLATGVGKKKHLQENDSGTMDLGEAGSEAAVTKQLISDFSFLKNDESIDEEARPSKSSLSESRKLDFESQMMIGTLLPLQETLVEDSSILNQSGQSRNLIDFDTTTTGSRRTESKDPSILSLVSAFTQPIEKNNFEAEKPSNKPPYLQVHEKETEVATSTCVASGQKLTVGTDSLSNEILARKRKAVALKREGKLVEAREELKQAKLLERSLEHDGHKDAVSESVTASTTSNTSTVQDKSSQTQKSLSSRDRFRIQQESLTHKRQALKLRREGKIDEADSELELAKSLEKQLEESDQSSSGNMQGGTLEAKDDEIMDLLDPQLISALKAIGLVDTPVVEQPSKKMDLQPKVKKIDDRMQLEEQIKAEKLRALNLKKAGKQADALEALRSAKRLEKKLASLG